MRRIGFLIFSAIVLLALYALNRYVAKRAHLAFGVSATRALLSQRGLLLVLAAAFVSRAMWFIWPLPAYKVLSIVTSSIELGIALTGVLLLSGQWFAQVRTRVGLAFDRMAKNESRRVEPSATSASGPSPASLKDGPVDLPRRQFLSQASVGGALCLGQSIAGYGSLRGRVDYQLEEAAVRIQGLPRSLDGFCIAQLSDIHIGQFTGEPELRIAKEFLQRARPDLIVLTGDLIDQQISMAPLLGQFLRSLEGIARYGVVTISGNHDFYAGVDEVAACIQQAGCPMLRNQGLFIGDKTSAFALLGVDDVWGQRVGLGPDLSRALQTLETDAALRLGLDVRSRRALELATTAPRVLLCHNPSYFEDSAGEIALQLSGHTHGGQIFPAGQLLQHSWVAGPYSKAGSNLYVNRGFGVVGAPARLLAPPEITRHILMA